MGPVRASPHGPRPRERERDHPCPNRMTRGGPGCDRLSLRDEHGIGTIEEDHHGLNHRLPHRQLGGRGLPDPGRCSQASGSRQGVLRRIGANQTSIRPDRYGDSRCASVQLQRCRQGRSRLSAWETRGVGVLPGHRRTIAPGSVPRGAGGCGRPGLASATTRATPHHLLRDLPLPPTDRRSAGGDRHSGKEARRAPPCLARPRRRERGGTEKAHPHPSLQLYYNQRLAWLVHAHARLDRAVWAAYGWDDPDPAATEEDAILARLLALNLERSELPATSRSQVT